MKITSMIARAIALAAASVATPALAHHSYAMFDVQKVVTVEGSVKEFLWTNPHGWIRMAVPNAQGKLDEWAVEMGSVSIMAHLGWTPKTLLPGDKISITMHPLKDGAHGGDFVAINSGARDKVVNDGGSQARLKERAAHREEGTADPAR